MDSQVAGHLSRVDDLLGREAEDRRELIDRLDRLIVDSGQAARSLGIVGARGVARLSSARFAADLLDDRDALAQRSTVHDDLAVMEWALRPSIPISALLASAADGIWPVLSDFDINAVAAHACRLDIGRNTMSRSQAGSGVLVEITDRQWVILTAAHVVESMRACGWEARDEIHAWAVFGENPSVADSRAVRLGRHCQMHPSQDVALLAAEDDDELANLQRADGCPTPGTAIAVIGYPYFDSRHDDWSRDFGFRDQPGVLRLSPGVILSVESRTWRGIADPLFIHDASTLSGSSGSAVIELPSMRLSGIHVGGWAIDPEKADGPFSSNAAVPLAAVDCWLAVAREPHSGRSQPASIPSC